MNPDPSTNCGCTQNSTGPASPSRSVTRSVAIVMTIATLIISPTGCRTPPAQTNAIKPIALHNIRTELEITARQRSNQRDSKLATGDEEYDESIFQQRLRLKADGYVYHPNLLDFSLAMVAGLQQSEFHQDRGGMIQNSAQNDTLEEFDVRASLFKNKDFPITLHGVRSRTFDPRPFRGSLETQTSSFDFTWQYVDPKTPTLFQLSRTNVDFNPFLRAGERPGSRRNSVARFETGYHFSEHNILSLRVSREQLEETPITIQYDTDRANLSHRIDFGVDKQHRFESTLRGYRQRGTFDIERIDWRETLRMKHTDRLRSSFVFEFIDRTQGDLFGAKPVQERSYLISSDLEHRLYDSLVSRSSGRAQRQEFGSGLEIERQTVGAFFDYQKKNPWGVLRSDFSVRLERQQRTGGDQVIAVIDESHTLRDPEPIIISDSNINQRTVTIIREDRTETYARGRDYRVMDFGNRIEIERVPTGRIRDDETVLVSYQVTLAGNFDLDTVQQRFGIRQEFDFGLNLYYRFYRQNQTISPLLASGVTVENITAQTLGGEYRKGTLHLFAEIEDHESTISPFESLRFGGEYTRQIGPATASISALWSDIQFRDRAARDVTLWTIDGRYRHPITRRFNIEAGVAYRNEQDTVGGDNEGIDFDLSADWSFRTTKIKLTYEYSLFENVFANDQSQAILVELVRRF